MEKKIIVIALAIATKINAQVNLVPNPSFEEYTVCPSNAGEINSATYWDSYLGSVDYFNACSTNTDIQTPLNLSGTQMPSYGNAYCGLITYWNGGLGREIVGVQLTSTLVISQKYYISFNVTRSDNYAYAGYSTNRIGAKFSKVKLFNVPINNSSTIFNNSVISDGINWTKCFGSFISDSTYKHLMLGNFFDDGNTTITNNGSGDYGYYLIDDVCLSTDSLFCKNYIAKVKENVDASELRVFPNPADNLIHIVDESFAAVEVYNQIGNQVDFLIVRNNGVQSIDCANWVSGMYLIKIKNRLRKVIINH